MFAATGSSGPTVTVAVASVAVPGAGSDTAMEQALIDAHVVDPNRPPHPLSRLPLSQPSDAAESVSPYPTHELAPATRWMLPIEAGACAPCGAVPRCDGHSVPVPSSESCRTRMLVMPAVIR